MVRLGPDMEKFYFTLSANQGGPGCVEITANDSSEAREAMFKAWGEKWAFMYTNLSDVYPTDRRIIVKIRLAERKPGTLTDAKIWDLWAETNNPLEFARAIMKAVDGTRTASA